MLLRGGATMTVYTKAQASARTNRVARLEREDDDFGDWTVLERPITADAAELPQTFDGDVISAKDLADVLDSNPDLWADVEE